jgi:hypothetical protein
MEEVSLQQCDIQGLNSNSHIYNKINVNPTELLVPNDLNIINKHLKEEGRIEISLENIKPDLIKKQTINLKFAGFVNIKQENHKLLAEKKTWKKVEITGNNTSSIPSTQSQNLINQDELIDPYDTYQKFAKENDCITKPKPCKNCNCGRAETENNKYENDTKTDNDAMKASNCGKCYLGDAYRCAGCPYRGKPAFKPGDKIELGNSELNDGIQQQEKESVNTKIAGSKVKIDLDI